MTTNNSKSGAVKSIKNEKGPIEFSISGLLKCILCAQEVPRENDKEINDIGSSLSRIEARLDEMERYNNADPLSEKSRQTSV